MADLTVVRSALSTCSSPVVYRSTPPLTILDHAQPWLATIRQFSDTPELSPSSSSSSVSLYFFVFHNQPHSSSCIYTVFFHPSEIQHIHSGCLRSFY